MKSLLHEHVGRRLELEEFADKSCAQNSYMLEGPNTVDNNYCTAGGRGEGKRPRAQKACTLIRSVGAFNACSEH